MAQSHSAVTLSVRIPPEMREQLEELADATGRTKSFLAAEAIEHYLQIQSWQTKAIKDAVVKANSGQATFYSHEEISNWLNSWGSSQELDAPK